MARRIKSKKSKHLGNRTYGAGNTKNRRGKGNKGGKGKAGAHKHKWLQTIKLGLHKPLKHGFHSRFAKAVEFTLSEISRQISSGKWQKEGGQYKVVLAKNSKVLSTGSLQYPAMISAGSFSPKASDKIKSAGGTAVELAPAAKAAPSA